MFGVVSDSDKLRSWSLLSEYQRQHAELVDLAKVTYLALYQALGAEPTQGQCTDVLAVALYGTNRFKNMVGRKQHMLPTFYWAYAKIMARYVLVENWNDIWGPHP